MPISTMVLYGGAIVAGLILLAIVVSTGNARGLASAITLLSIDLLVTIISLVLYLLPQYAHEIYPLLVRIHAVLCVSCLAWAGMDAFSERHTLSRTFFAGFIVYAVQRAAGYFILHLNHGHSKGTALCYIDVGVYVLICFALILSLFVPVEPETQKHKSPRVAASPMAALARVRR